MDRYLAHRRDLRRDSTDSEALLWRALRAHRFSGFKFRRQHSVGPYILDFYCPSRSLAIELDGGQHYEEPHRLYDQRRTQYLSRQGIKVLRFQSDLAIRELDAVLQAIAEALSDTQAPNR